MKKYGLIMVIVLLVLLSGCKKTEDTTNQVDPGITKDEEDVTEGMENVAPDTGTDPEEVTTVTEDVYGTTELEVVDSRDFSEATGTDVTDAAILAEMQTYIEKFSYNFLYHPTNPTGGITEQDMQLFAISYIYQYEYNELRFDADTFVLYIPEQNVTDVIKRFFDYDFTDHRYPAGQKVTYEDGYYLMPARDEALDPPTLTKALKINDFDYKIFFEVPRTDANNVTTLYKYEMVIEERNERFVVMNYKQTEPALAVDTTTTTETTTTP